MKTIIELIQKKAKALQAKGDKNAVYDASNFYKKQLQNIAARYANCIRIPKHKLTTKQMGGMQKFPAK